MFAVAKTKKLRLIRKSLNDIEQQHSTADIRRLSAVEACRLRHCRQSAPLFTDGKITQTNCNVCPILSSALHQQANFATSFATISGIISNAGGWSNADAQFTFAHLVSPLY